MNKNRKGVKSTTIGKALIAILVVVSLGVITGCSSLAPAMPKSITPFTQEESLEEYVTKAALWEKEISKMRYGCSESDKPDIECIVVTASKRESSLGDTNGSITNNQEQGVDEGDVVKRVGNYLVVLRRGRIFSFSLASETGMLAATDFIDVAPKSEHIEAWYDEILNYNNTIILLGYSYEANLTLIRKFELSKTGELSYGDSYFFASNDYFDVENYATRLIGNSLIFYIPSPLRSESQNDIQSGRIVNGKPADVGSAFIKKTIYKPVQHSDEPIIHTVARCPVDRSELRCTTTGITGPESQLLYISKDAVYLWLNSAGWAYNYFLINDRWLRRLARNSVDDYSKYQDTAIVYRIPIDGSEPSLVGVKGKPMNQFSFREKNAALQVIMRYDNEDYSQPGLLDIPLYLFKSELYQLPTENYTSLPPLSGYMNVNRFIGSKLLYSDSDYYAEPPTSTLLVKDLTTNSPPVTFELEHFIERIEPVDSNAIVIGSDRKTGMGLTSFDLSGQPQKVQSIILPRLIQADARSHSFNYTRRDDFNLLGLPFIEVPENVSYEDFWIEKACDVQMRYFRFDESVGLQELGKLVGKRTEKDFCLTSCADWYGDARPFFINERIYALLGYEIIEGYFSGGVIYESNRVGGLELLDENYISGLK